MDLLQKHMHLVERQQRMLALGLDEVVVCIDEILSPTQAVINGVIDVRDIVFFASLIAFWLFANTVAVEARRAG